MKYTLTAKGTHCKSCTMLITEALEVIGAKNIIIKLDEKKQESQVVCEYEGKIEDVKKAIEKEGYKAE